MKTYTLEKLTDKHIGKKGTSKRDAFEIKLERDLIIQSTPKTPAQK
jgi:HTH-type transcriptional regulator/antitoxin HipB